MSKNETITFDCTFFKNKDFMKKSSFLRVKPYPVCPQITSRMFARHYDIHDVTKSVNLTL